MNPSPFPYNSAHVRARIVKILLIIAAVATLISVLFDALSLAFPPLTAGEEVENNPMGAVMVLLILLLGILELMIYLTTVVFFCMWLYRSYNNLRAFDQWGVPDYSAGLAVGSFFIPFVNLVLPYRCVREVWQKSGLAGEDRFSAPDPPASFPLWWMFWILASVVGQISIRVSFNDNIPHSTAALVSMLASALSLMAAVFAYLVV